MIFRHGSSGRRTRPLSLDEVNILGRTDWHLAYVLPDLKIREAQSNVSGMVSLVPLGDARLLEIKKRSLAAKKLLEGFHDGYDHPVYPAALIFREDAPEKVKTVSAMVDFRNCIAMACILPGWAQNNLTMNTTPNNPLWSDFFDFYPVVVVANDTLVVNNLL